MKTQDIDAPWYQVGEDVIVGAHASDETIRNRSATVARQLYSEEIGVWFYHVEIGGRLYQVVELTLCKVFEPGSWADCLWRPREGR